jgi:hypothetical protein
MLRYFFFIVIVIVACSCKKQPNCSASKISITTNSPVVEGWPLYLSSMESVEYLYEWSGPNGFHISYNVFSTTANRQGKENVTAEDAGTYTVKMRNRDGCVEYEGSVDVSVIPAPEAPCDVPVNSTISSVAGVGGSNYTGDSLDVSDDIYDLGVFNATEEMVIRFTKEPKPGVYLSSGVYSPLSDDKAAIYIISGFYDFLMEVGYKVYVTKTNGKLNFSFCNAKFLNPVSASPLIISARIRKR